MTVCMQCVYAGGLVGQSQVCDRTIKQDMPLSEALVVGKNVKISEIGYVGQHAT